MSICEIVGKDMEAGSSPGFDIGEALVRSPTTTFFVRVKGESMQGAGILPGDVLIVDRALTAYDKSIIVARLGSEFLVKRLRLLERGIFLYPENPFFPTVDVAPEDDFEVWGVVSGVARSYVGAFRK